MSTANDVLKNALANEVKAAAFYNLAAELTPYDEARMLFIELAGLEEDHTKEFLEKAKGSELLDGFDAETYLKELENEMDEVSKTAHNDLFESGDMMAILDFAIKMEIHAHDTYKVMASMVENIVIKKYCKELAEEEDGHRKMLEQAKASLTMDDADRPML